jgi:hypothetical protein
VDFRSEKLVCIGLCPLELSYALRTKNFTMPDSLQIALKNDSDSSNLHAYITGIAIQQGGQRCILKANGHDLYFPQNPPAIGSPLAEDCAIPLGNPGNTTTVTVRILVRTTVVIY